jgi:hypothetical protein
MSPTDNLEIPASRAFIVNSWAFVVHLLENHGHAIWACDFVPAATLLFQTVYAFGIVQLRDRGGWSVSTPWPIRPTPGWRSRCAKPRLSVRKPNT